MAWITSDTDVACSLIVSKTVNGQAVPGYPKQYSILDGFGEYPAITKDGWHKMLIAPRNQRIDAFKVYMGQTENINVNVTQLNSVYRSSTETPGVVVEA